MLKNFIANFLLLATIRGDDSLRCKSHYGLNELSNQIVENGFCLADAGRTCCSPKDALKVRMDVESIRAFGGLSP